VSWVSGVERRPTRRSPCAGLSRRLGRPLLFPPPGRHAALVQAHSRRGPGRRVASPRPRRRRPVVHRVRRRIPTGCSREKMDFRGGVPVSASERGCAGWPGHRLQHVVPTTQRSAVLTRRSSSRTVFRYRSGGHHAEANHLHLRLGPSRGPL
jgi:hypothetical protein